MPERERPIGYLPSLWERWEASRQSEMPIGSVPNLQRQPRVSCRAGLPTCCPLTLRNQRQTSSRAGSPIGYSTNLQRWQEISYQAAAPTCYPQDLQKQRQACSQPEVPTCSSPKLPRRLRASFRSGRVAAPVGPKVPLGRLGCLAPRTAASTCTKPQVGIRIGDRLGDLEALARGAPGETCQARYRQPSSVRRPD